jgi:DNA repair exonuclease SbcCD nuclease subunit
MFRFIHSSDLHLGKRFGQFSGDLPGRLREARHGAIGRLAAHAKEQGASVVLLAGDTFDAETPDPSVRRQALTEMQQHAPVRWVILPGNHDSLQASPLWEALAEDCPDNVILAVDPEIIEIAPGVMLLPAPCTTRRPGADPTRGMDDAHTPEGVIRIGLAHGAVTRFSENDSSLEIIAPDRAERAHLDYLALGDWHGRVQVNAHTFYSGSPEPDRFKHDKPGQALLVAVEAANAPCQVTPIETGSFVWSNLTLDLLEGEDPLASLKNLLPDLAKRRQSLVKIEARGQLQLAQRASLSAAVETLQEDFAFLSMDASALQTLCEVEDLDAIDHAGALRQAADTLLADSTDDRLDQASRDVARAALERLYVFAQGSTA